MDTLRLLSCVVLMAAALIACSEEDKAHSSGTHADGYNLGTPGAEYDLDQRELVALVEQANHGDMSSIKRLVNYYSWVHSDPKEAIPWLRVAASRGDVAAMQDLAGRVAMSGSKRECMEANALLEAAWIASSGSLRDSIKEDMDLLRYGSDGRGSCVKWFESRATDET